MALLKQILVVAAIATFTVATYADAANDAAAKNKKSSSQQKRPMIETSWLSGQSGFKGELLGAEILSVAPDAKDTTKDTIEVAIPVPQGQRVEEVIVIEKADPSLQKPEVKYDVKVVKDYEGGRSGIIVTLGKNVPFKLMFNYVEHSP